MAGSAGTGPGRKIRGIKIAELCEQQNQPSFALLHPGDASDPLQQRLVCPSVRSRRWGSRASGRRSGRAQSGAQHGDSQVVTGLGGVPPIGVHA